MLINRTEGDCSLWSHIKPKVEVFTKKFPSKVITQHLQLFSKAETWGTRRKVDSPILCVPAAEPQPEVEYRRRHRHLRLCHLTGK